MSGLSYKHIIIYYKMSVIPLVSLSLSKTNWKASGAKASPAFTNKDLFILMVPESAFLA